MIIELISAVVVLAASNGGPTAPTPSPGQPQPTSTPTSAAPSRTPGPTLAPTLAPTPTPAPTAVRPASVAIVWHVVAAPSSDQSVRAAAIALSAPDTLGAIERALRAHPRARFSLAIDASALAGLQSAAEGDSALQAMVAGHLVGGARADMLRVLAQVPVFDSSLAMTPAARRYRSLAAAAPLALAGQRSATFTAADYVELAGLGALTRLAAVGQLGSLASDLDKSTLTDAQAAAAVAQLAAVDRTTLDELKQLALSGQLELIADPAGEPILPLLIDGGGKSGANIVMTGAGADAATLSDQALHGVEALQSGAAGVYSPHGAYDDATATMLAQHHATFALFSDRVLRSSPIGGSREAVLAADSGAYHAYALHAAAGPALSALFWSQDDGTALSVLPPGLPAGAMGERVSELARTAGARGGDIIVLRIEGEGLWNRRADRAHVVDALAAALSDRVTSVTVAQYIHIHPPTLSSFGFAAAADAGSLAYWMGTLNQAKMWTALGDARQAAGGDAALAREGTRAALFEAEASRFYLTPNMIAPQSEVDRLMGQFRSLIARIYQTSGKSAPASIAPLSPEPTPPRPHQ